jgi:hypothetical protein
VLVFAGRLKDIGNASVLQLNEQEMLRDWEIVDLANARQGQAPLELVILEAFPHRDAAERAYGLTASFAQELTTRLCCPVVAVSHSGAYLASLPATPPDRPLPAADANDVKVQSQLSMLTAHMIYGLHQGLSVERCAYEARQMITSAKKLMTAPIVYLPTHSSPDASAAGGLE